MRSRQAVGHGQNKKVQEKSNDAKTGFRQRHGTLKTTHANIVMSEGKSGGKNHLQGSTMKKILVQTTTFQDKAKHRKLHNQPSSWP
jgi:hypothetical protein